MHDTYLLTYVQFLWLQLQLSIRELHDSVAAEVINNHEITRWIVWPCNLIVFLAIVSDTSTADSELRLREGLDGTLVLRTAHICRFIYHHIISYIWVFISQRIVSYQSYYINGPSTTQSDYRLTDKQANKLPD